MAAKTGTLLLLVPLACVGCFHSPARICLTPPYDAPGGFSETYHAALAASEPLLQPGVAPLPPSGIVVSSPYLILPGGSTSAEPPMEW